MLQTDLLSIIRSLNTVYAAIVFVILVTRVGPKFSGLTYKSRTKWKRLRGIYSAMYGEVNVSVSVCVEIKEDYIKKLQICFISVTLKRWLDRKLLDPPSYVDYLLTRSGCSILTSLADSQHN